MHLILDTNVIVRLLVLDDTDQVARATGALSGATTAVAPNAALCEAAWVLRSRYRLPTGAIRAALASLVALPGVVTDRSRVAAGFAFLDSGADFADGIIAAEGRELGGEVFLSFDTRAVAAAERNGFVARAP